MTEKYIGLVRVSTEKQGQSGLGLLAGKADLEEYVAARGAQLLEVLVEVESGGHDDILDRPTLGKALRLCKRHRATLLIPKVDRLVRSTEVHTDIKRSGVPFRAVDMPEANEFTLDILVAVAAFERRQVSERTRKALAAYKAEGRVSKRVREMYGGNVPPDVQEKLGGKLGSHLVGCHLTDEGRARGRAKANAKRKREAAESQEDLLPDILAWRQAGMTLSAIADKLNADGHVTREGCRFTKTQIFRLIARAR